MSNRNNSWLIIWSRIVQGRFLLRTVCTLAGVMLALAVIFFIFQSSGGQKRVPLLVGASYSLPAESASGSIPSWQQDFNPAAITGLFPKKFFSSLPFSPNFLTSAAAGAGLKFSVSTTMDEKIQFKLIKMMRRYHPQLGAAVLMDLETGAILAMAEYRNESEGTILPEDCGNLCLISAFPAASLFKIVTAYGVLEKKPVTRKTRFKVVGRHHTLYKYQLGLGKSRYHYRPDKISFEKAFARSVNPVFGCFGINYFTNEELFKLAESFAFNRQIAFDQTVQASHIELPQTPFQRAETSSGFIKTTRLSPLHAMLMAGAPLMVDSLPQPYVIKRVVDANGAEIYYHQAQKCAFQLKDKKACRELVAMMRATVRYGTARKSFRDVRRRRSFRKLEVGGKTGSLDMPDNIHRCEWFAGFGKNPATGKMVAVAVVLVHGEKRTISSGYIASELIAASLKE